MSKGLSARGDGSGKRKRRDGDCDIFCVFCRTEVNEKTTRPETNVPGTWPWKTKTAKLWRQMLDVLEDP